MEESTLNQTMEVLDEAKKVVSLSGKQAVALLLGSVAVGAIIDELAHKIKWPTFKKQPKVIDVKQEPEKAEEE